MSSKLVQFVNALQCFRFSSSTYFSSREIKIDFKYCENDCLVVMVFHQENANFNYYYERDVIQLERRRCFFSAVAFVAFDPFRLVLACAFVRVCVFGLRQSKGTTEGIAKQVTCHLGNTLNQSIRIRVSFIYSCSCGVIYKALCTRRLCGQKKITRNSHIASASEFIYHVRMNHLEHTEST